MESQLGLDQLFFDPRILRKFWFEALSQAMDGYLRSTAFLEFMQQSLRTMTVSESRPIAEPFNEKAHPIDDSVADAVAENSPVPAPHGDSPR